MGPVIKTLALSILLCLGLCAVQVQGQKQRFNGRVVADNIIVPWEVTEGPDGWLWTTERIGIVERIHPDSGMRDTILDIRDRVFSIAEFGLLGLALHPNFADTPIVVLAYNTRNDSVTARTVSAFRYDGDTLIEEHQIFHLEPAGLFHQGTRIKFAPDRTLFITTGDQPDFWRTMDSTSYMGKMLRFNLDGSIPEDNPYPGLAMWTSGHRNIQGLMFLPDGRLLASEHGNLIEDEINEIVKGDNFGWPLVEGPCDTEDEAIACEQYNVKGPFWSTGQETFAFSDMDFYNHDRYPLLKNSILITTLKHSSVVQIKLNETLDSIVSVTTLLQRAYGRLRDVCVSKDGRIYIATSNKDLLAYFPYPRVDDDKIIELVPVPDTSVGVIVMPDTFDFGTVVVGDSAFYNVKISNIGDAPLTVDYLYMKGITDTASIHTRTWRLPFHIMPGGEYEIEMLYKPLTDSPHIDSMEIGISGIKRPGVHYIWYKGNTTGGLLKPLNDSASAETNVDGTVELRVEFKNIGNQPVVVDSVTIDGLNSDEFTTNFVPPFTVMPLATFGITVQHKATELGVREARLLVHSSSYREPVVTLLSNVVATSVEDDDYGMNSGSGEGADDDGASGYPSASGVRSYVVDLLGRVVNEQGIVAGPYYRVTITRTGVVCTPLFRLTR